MKSLLDSIRKKDINLLYPHKPVRSFAILADLETLDDRSGTMTKAWTLLKGLFDKFIFNQNNIHFFFRIYHFWTNQECKFFEKFYLSQADFEHYHVLCRFMTMLENFSNKFLIWVIEESILIHDTMKLSQCHKKILLFSWQKY